RILDFSDRNSCVLFGDGAGAAVLSRTDEPGRGLRYFRLYADGSKPELLQIPGGGSRFPASAQSLAPRQPFVQIHRPPVYKFAVTRMQELIEEAMADCGLSIADVDLLIPHQVNQRIIDSAISQMNFPAEKVMMNLARYGNTASASVPLALDEAIRSGRAR